MLERHRLRPRRTVTGLVRFRRQWSVRQPPGVLLDIHPMSHFLTEWHADCLTWLAYRVAGGDAEQSTCVEIDPKFLGAIEDGQFLGGAD